jgi:hypothetical protein
VAPALRCLQELLLQQQRQQLPMAELLLQVLAWLLLLS